MEPERIEYEIMEAMAVNYNARKEKGSPPLNYSSLRTLFYRNEIDRVKKLEEMIRQGEDSPYVHIKVTSLAASQPSLSIGTGYESGEIRAQVSPEIVVSIYGINILETKEALSHLSAQGVDLANDIEIIGPNSSIAMDILKKYLAANPGIRSTGEQAGINIPANNVYDLSK